MLMKWRGIPSGLICRRCLGTGRAYQAMVLHANGTLTNRLFRVKDLLSFPEIHARDLLSLSLQETPVSSNINSTGGGEEVHPSEALLTKRHVNAMDRPIPLILPRGKSIVVALGHIRGCIRMDHCIFFDAHIPTVRQSIEEISEIVEQIQGQGSSFEMAVLEASIKTLCERYQRRARLFSSSVEYMLADGEINLNPESGKYQQILAIRDGLTSFTLRVDDLIVAFADLLSNDEDMAELQLTEKQKIQDVGVLHGSVELLIENYHRQLSLIHQQMVQLERRLKTRQELEALNLDVYRNRLIMMDLEISMRSVGLSCCTVMAGFFGMNIHSGLETHEHYVFYGVCAGVSAAAYGYYKKMIRELNKMRTMLSKRDDLFAWKDIFDNMAAVERVIQRNLHTPTLVDEQEIQRQLSSLVGGDVSWKESEIVHAILARERKQYEHGQGVQAIKNQK
jgi:Mg2+ and Co2+ transporter CorA